jgi:hypothetical protein
MLCATGMRQQLRQPTTARVMHVSHRAHCALWSSHQCTWVMLAQPAWLTRSAICAVSTRKALRSQMYALGPLALVLAGYLRGSGSFLRRQSRRNLLALDVSNASMERNHLEPFLQQLACCTGENTVHCHNC